MWIGDWKYSACAVCDEGKEYGEIENRSCKCGDTNLEYRTLKVVKLEDYEKIAGKVENTEASDTTMM